MYVCSAECDDYPGLIITQCICALHSINVYSYCVDLKRKGGRVGREADGKGGAGSEDRAQLCGPILLA